MIPGEYILKKEPVDYNVGYEANEEGLKFDREKAYGKRLDIAAGTAIRFEPGEEREVSLVDFGGKRRIFGFNNKVNDYLDRK